MLSEIELEFWMVLCRARSWSWWSLWVLTWNKLELFGLYIFSYWKGFVVILQGHILSLLMQPAVASRKIYTFCLNFFISLHFRHRSNKYFCEGPHFFLQARDFLQFADVFCPANQLPTGWEVALRSEIQFFYSSFLSINLAPQSSLSPASFALFLLPHSKKWELWNQLFSFLLSKEVIPLLPCSSTKAVNTA